MTVFPRYLVITIFSAALLAGVASKAEDDAKHTGVETRDQAPVYGTAGARGCFERVNRWSGRSSSRDRITDGPVYMHGDLFGTYQGKRGVFLIDGQEVYFLAVNDNYLSQQKVSLNGKDYYVLGAVPGSYFGRRRHFYHSKTGSAEFSFSTEPAGRYYRDDEFPSPSKGKLIRVTNDPEGMGAMRGRIDQLLGERLAPLLAAFQRQGENDPKKPDAKLENERTLAYFGTPEEVRAAVRYCRFSLMQNGGNARVALAAIDGSLVEWQARSAEIQKRDARLAAERAEIRAAEKEFDPEQIQKREEEALKKARDQKIEEIRRKYAENRKGDK